MDINEKLIVYVRAAGVLIPLGKALLSDLKGAVSEPFGGSVEEILAGADAGWKSVLDKDALDRAKDTP